MAKIWSASLIQVNGWQRWFQPSQNQRIAATNSPTLGRREVQVDPRVAGQPGLDLGVLVGGVVVEHDMQLPARVRLGDELEEG